MKRFGLFLVIFVALLACPLALGQGARYDSFSWQTVYIQGSNVFTPTPFAIVNVCSYPANAVPCTNYATTYTDITLGTACASSVPLVLGGNTCVATADVNGDIGFWAAAGNYDYTITTSKGSFGPYHVTLGVGGSSGGGNCPVGSPNDVQLYDSVGNCTSDTGVITGDPTTGTTSATIVKATQEVDVTDPTNNWFQNAGYSNGTAIVAHFGQSLSRTFSTSGGGYGFNWPDSPL